MRFYWLVGALAVLVAVVVSAAGVQVPRDPVREVPLPDREFGKHLRVPTVASWIRTPDEAEKVFGKDARVKDLVDFKAETLLHFGWQGASDDKLTAAVQKEDNKTLAVFTYTPGKKTDMRLHSKVFAISQDISRWRFPEEPKKP